MFKFHCNFCLFPIKAGSSRVPVVYGNTILRELSFKGILRLN